MYVCTPQSPSAPARERCGARVHALQCVATQSLDSTTHTASTMDDDDVTMTTTTTRTDDDDDSIAGARGRGGGGGNGGGGAAFCCWIKSVIYLFFKAIGCLFAISSETANPNELKF